MIPIGLIAKGALAFIKLKAPQICFGAGLAAGGAAIVATAKAAPEIQRVMEHNTEKFELLKEAKETGNWDGFQLSDGSPVRPEDYKKLKAAQTGTMVRQLAKAGLKVIVCVLISVAFLSAGFHILNGRLQATATALAGVSAAYDKLAENVKFKYGEKEFQRLRYCDMKELSKATTEEEKKELSDPFRSYAKNARSNTMSLMWDENTWDPEIARIENPVMRVRELYSRIQQLRKKYAADTYVTLNEIAIDLGISVEADDRRQKINYVHGVDALRFDEVENVIERLNHTMVGSPEERAIASEINRGFIFDLPKISTLEDESHIKWGAKRW